MEMRDIKRGAGIAIAAVGLAGVAVGGAMLNRANGSSQDPSLLFADKSAAAAELHAWLAREGTAVDLGALGSKGCVRVRLPGFSLTPIELAAVGPGGDHNAPEAYDIQEQGPDAMALLRNVGDGVVRLAVGSGGGLPPKIEAKVCRLGSNSTSVTFLGHGFTEARVLEQPAS